MQEAAGAHDDQQGDASAVEKGEARHLRPLPAPRTGANNRHSSTGLGLDHPDVSEAVGRAEQAAVRGPRWKGHEFRRSLVKAGSPS